MEWALRGVTVSAGRTADVLAGMAFHAREMEQAITELAQRFRWVKRKRLTVAALEQFGNHAGAVEFDWPHPLAHQYPLAVVTVDAAVSQRELDRVRRWWREHGASALELPPLVIRQLGPYPNPVPQGR